MNNKIKNILDKIEIVNKINIPESYLDNIIDDFILNDNDLIITHDNIECTYGYIGNKKYILKVIDNKDNTYNFSVYSVKFTFAGNCSQTFRSFCQSVELYDL